MASERGFPGLPVRYHYRQRYTNAGATLSIAALGMAVAYLPAIVAGAIKALLLMIWLFGETAGAATSIGDKNIIDPCETLVASN